MKRIEPGAPMPTFRVRGVSGEELSIGRADSWELVVVYRGKHCPLCSRYLSTFNRLLDDFRSLGIRVIALSADLHIQLVFAPAPVLKPCRKLALE